MLLQQVKMAGKVPEFRSDCAVAQLNGYMVINGGLLHEDADEAVSTSDTWLFSLARHEWQQLDTGTCLLCRFRHSAVAIHDSMLFLGML